jgi:alpha-beta hydrolase superfamily lysophospholipase
VARAALTRLILCLAIALAGSRAAASEKVPLTLRGKAFALELYRPATGTPKGTILIGGGDVGWVGLAVDLAGVLSGHGYAVVGINSRQYLATFTSGSSHVTPEQVAADYAAMAQHLRDRQMLWAPVVVAGVSEGAGLAVLAGAVANHSWIKGVITIGLPPTAELAWRWRDALSWVTKSNPSEPSFEPKQYMSGISPLPLWMIQSTKDEYITEADYRAIDNAARPPKRLVLIDAGNHRFTDRLPVLRQRVLEGLEWIQNPR